MYVVDVYKERALTTTFQIDDAILVNFVTAVAQRYHDHPFHNFRHGFSVMQTTYILLRDAALADALSAVDVLLCSRLQASAFKFFETGVFPYNTDVHSDREQMLEALVHACDLSGQTMMPTLAAQWEQRVLAEFIRQAEEEESKDLPVAPFMLGLAESRLAQVKTQIDFINYAVRPVRRLFVCLTACLCVEVSVCGVL